MRTHIILWLLAVMLVLHAPSRLVAQQSGQSLEPWPAAPLACFPDRAVKWNAPEEKEPCHCPPQSMCPQNTLEWNDTSRHKMPIRVVMSCCNSFCTGSEIQAVVYREVAASTQHLSGPKGNKALACDEQTVESCGEDIGGGMVRVPVYVCLSPCLCKPEIAFKDQDPDCAASFANFVKPQGIKTQDFITSIRDVTPKAWVDQNKAVVDVSGGETWLSLIDLPECYPPPHNVCPSDNREGVRDDNGFIVGMDDGSTYCHPGSCVTKGAKITMADGTYKNIEDVKVGDLLKGAEGKGKVTAVSIQTRTNLTMYGVNGGVPFITSDHPILTTKGWKAIQSEKARKTPGVTPLAAGDVMLTSTESVEIKSIEAHEMKDATTTYNLMIENNGSFYANGIAVKSARDVQVLY